MIGHGRSHEGKFGIGEGTDEEIEHIVQSHALKSRQTDSAQNDEESE